MIPRASNTRPSPAPIRHLGALCVLLALPALLLPGCGKQDLYEVPGSPYTVAGRVPLPSINEGVAVIGSTALVAAGEAGLHVVDIADPTAPQLLSTINTTKYADDVQVVRILTDGVLRDIAHVVEGTEGVTSYDVTDPLNPTDYQTGTTAVVGRTVYIDQPDDPSVPYTVYLAEDWKGVRIFESIPADPGILAYNGVFVGTQGAAYGLVVQDGWGYCADNEMGLAVLDLRVLDLDAVNLAAWSDTPGNARAVALEGGHAFVADGTEGLAVFAITAGEVPVKLAQYDLSGFNVAIAVRDGLCALAANGGGVHFLDVSDPANPIYLGSTATSYATDVALGDDGTCIVVDEDDGLLVLTGRGPFADHIAPAPVTDLVATAAGATAIELDWTMTGDDRLLGHATAVEIRRSDAAITTDEAWDAASVVGTVLDLADAGQPEAFIATGLAAGADHHFALRVIDDTDHVSGLSNPAFAATGAGIVLRDGTVDIAAGTDGDTYTYSVEVLWDGALTVTEVLIDGEAHTMTEAAPGQWQYQTTLARGVHDFAFRFAAEGVDAVTTDTAPGPVVGALALTLGSEDDEPGRSADEVRQRVALSRPVIAAATEVTQAQWNAVMPAGSNPSTHPGDDRPVDSVTWLQAIEYCNALSVADGLTPAYTVAGEMVTWNREADGWRLPTEAEWEHVARGGAATSLPNGDLAELNCRLDANLDAIGWYCGNGSTAPQAVAQKDPNGLGLYDVCGNVREWCWDWYGPRETAAALDPSGPETGLERLCRGGSWFGDAQSCRPAARGALPPDSADDTIGLRPVRSDLGR
jgi:formylglycine-generating enzyme required for sulfatase activity